MISIASANGIRIAYDTFGSASARPLVLVMGVGAQMITWREDFCAALAERGFFVVRFDNRDVGASTHLHDAPWPDFPAVLAGDHSSVSYRLEDMAADTVGLLDALGLKAAHVVGASMGGMIAQTLAIRHPERVLSLTSMMSTPWVGIGAPTDEARAVLFSPPPTTREEAIERSVAVHRVIGSPGYPFDEAWQRELAGRAWDRGLDPAGVARQLLAIYASGDRTGELAQVRAPALVVHGEVDPVVQLVGGKATAAALPDAELLVLPGMGHNLPQAVWPLVIDAVAALTAHPAGELDAVEGVSGR